MSVRKITLAALFLALCYVLPFLSGSIPVVGKMLLLMHLPVFFAGLLLGWQYGLLIGLIAPITRSFMFGAPYIYPDAIVMALELMTYGAISGLLYKLLKKANKYVRIFVSLITAMIVGRAVWGISKTILLSLGGKAFTFELFIAGGFINAWPGIILQLVLIPLLLPVLEKIVHKRENKEVKK